MRPPLDETITRVRAPPYYSNLVSEKWLQVNGAGDELDWNDWQESLLEEFRAGRGRPVFFYADDDVLTEIGGEDGPASLAAAVLAKLVSFGDPYKNVALLAAKKKLDDPDQPPPTLPLLALSVFAATRMERTAGVAPHAYYHRFFEVAGVAAGSPLGVAMKKNFDTVATLWQQFHGWMQTASGQEFGVSTIRLINKHLTLIGYPLSQALLRRADRNTLTHLWAAMGQDTSASLSADDLVQHLRRWMRSSRGLSKQFCDTVNGLDDKTLPEFGKALQDAAKNWDGVVLSRSGSKLHEAVLAVQSGLNELRKAVWLVASAGGTVAVPLKAADLIGMPTIYSADGQEWAGDSDGLAVLIWDSLMGCWISTVRMLAGVNHALVWHPALAEAVKKFVGRSRNAGQLHPRRLNDGVGFIEGVLFSTDKEITDALADAGLSGIRVAGTTSPRLSLSDGLKVTNALHGAIYIHGGEPDLAIPPGDEPFLPVCLDGDALRDLPRGVLSPLRDFTQDLAPGHHILESQDGSVEFETLSPGEVVVQPGPRIDSGALPEMSLNFAAAGLDPFGTRLVIVKRHRDHTWLLGKGGHIRVLTDPALPPYWDRLLADTVDPLHYLVIRKANESWLVQKSFDQFFVEQLVDSIPELAVDDLAVDREAWTDVLRGAAHFCDRPEWKELLMEAGIE